MDDRDLRKLSRQDLMEMLLELSKENDRLKADLEEAQKELQSKRIRISEAGNIAEASLRLNRVFESAQDAAVQYLANIRMLEKQKQREIAQLREMQNKLNEKKDS